jgi:hypothetical protein
VGVGHDLVLSEQLGAVAVRVLPLLCLHLDPYRARARPIRRIPPLAHDALEAAARALGQQDIGAGEGIAKSDQVALVASE